MYTYATVPLSLQFFAYVCAASSYVYVMSRADKYMKVYISFAREIWLEQIIRHDMLCFLWAMSEPNRSTLHPVRRWMC